MHTNARLVAVGLAGGVFISGILLAAFWRWPVHQQAVVPPHVIDARPTVEFAGQTWNWQSEISMRAYVGSQFSTLGLPNIRLIDVSMAGPSGHKIRRMEIRAANGTWVKHGPEQVVWDDGRREYSHFELDQQIGLLQVWHPNGQLKTEQHYGPTGKNGPARGWSEDGALQWDVVYQDDKQVAVNFPVALKP